MVNNTVESGAEVRATAWLAAWDAQGIHRTGTAGDEAGAAWLAHEAAALGAMVEEERFGFNRLDPVACYLEINGERIAGVPVFDAPPTDAMGIAGRMAAVGSVAEIAVAELGPRSVYSGEFGGLRRTAGHRALAVICRGEAAGLALINAEQFKTTYGMPAIHVSSEAGERVRRAASTRAAARLVSHSQWSLANAANTVATIKGSGSDKPPLVVMTPRSSWWQSTAERGGGIVCWLESLRALIVTPPARDVVFTANTGHELGHLGLDEFLARRLGWDREGGADWVHFGANIGAAGGRLSLVSNADELRALGLEALGRVGQPPDDASPPTQAPSGETRDVHRAGGRYLTLVGTNRLFHLPQDRWPQAVDVPAIARIAAAGAEIMRRLAG
jgi:hypothetical protein